MCLLILLTGVDADFPVLVASNRDEERSRRTSPPGLFVGSRRRMLSPRDARAGGTWLGVSDHKLFAALTNVTKAPKRAGARSRGTLPHLALDQDDVASAVAAVRDEVTRAVFDGFQLVVSDGADTRVLVFDAKDLAEHRIAGGAVVLSNEHRLGELTLPGLDAACVRGLALERRFELLSSLLLDQGERSGHRVLKKGGEYGTVSSTLLAIPAGDLRGLRFCYAAGPPDETPYRDYGNLARRLLDDQ